MFLITVFVCFCIASIINYFKTRRQRSFITNLKGPFTFPLVGSLHKILFLTPKNFHKKSQQYLKEFGDFSRCWIFHRLFIPTADYELVEQLLNSRSHLHTGYNLLGPLLGDGLLMCDGDKWNQRRQLISHGAFNGAALGEFVEIFNEHSATLVERLSGVSNGNQTFDIEDFVSKAVLDIMIDATLGIKGRAQHDAGTEYSRSISEVTSHFIARYLKLSSANNATYTILCPIQKHRQRRLIKTINKINMEVINERYSDSAWKNEKPDEKYGNIYTIKMDSLGPYEVPVHHINLLDILLDARIDDLPLKDTEICSELNTFLFQGYLLTTSALSSLLVMLARHPRVQAKVKSEIEQVFSNHKESEVLKLSALDQLKYMECVIMETLRLYPALPVIGRELNEPFEYTHSKVGNGVLPVGSEIYINVFEMLRNEEKFPEPTRFNPERFSERTDKVNSLLYFSLGPRDCIARKFAILLLKTVLVNILSAYEILPFGNEVCLEFKITLKSSNGFQVGLQPR